MQSSFPDPGQVVIIRRERWRVMAVTKHDCVARIDAARLGPRTPQSITFFVPFDQVDGGESSRRPQLARRQRWGAALNGVRAQAEHVDLPLIALSADISLWPYQLEPMLALRDGIRRVLIADAVGLGKTIQAGLIVAELLRRREAARVLIAAPSHLCRQWREELHARFRLEPRVADASALADLAASLPREASPWSIDGIWIGSLDFLKQSHILAGLPPDPWDLVVIDEAHMVTGHSDRRAAADSIARTARRVLLLTATPLSGLDDGRVLMSIGAIACPERSRRGSTDALVVFRRTRADVGIRAERRVRSLRVTPSDDERRALDLLDAFAKAAIAASTSSGGSTMDATQLLVAVLVKRALSTFAALAISVDRRLAHLSGLAIEPIDATQTSFDFGDADVAALTATISIAREQERVWMRRLGRAAAAAARTSRKMTRLLRLLSRTAEPVIIFTEFRDSLDALAHAISRRRHAFAVAHGALTAAELDAALDAFRRGDVRILVATDVASQGLNLHQRARWVIHLDLPWNPIRLEQRAGRVDRLGQTRAVHVTKLVMSHERDRAFGDRLALREEAAAASAALVNDTRWRRRARASAVVLERRRRLCRAWRGAVLRGRPLKEKGGSSRVRVWEIDIDGTETLILGSTARGGSNDSGGSNDHGSSNDSGGSAGPPAFGRRVQVRARRVARLTAARARAAAEVERALVARIIVVDDEQPTLPGALAANDRRRADARSTAAVAARRVCEARIAALETRAQAQSPAITARLRFLTD